MWMVCEGDLCGRWVLGVGEVVVGCVVVCVVVVGDVVVLFVDVDDDCGG